MAVNPAVVQWVGDDTGGWQSADAHGPLVLFVRPLELPVAAAPSPGPLANVQIANPATEAIYKNDRAIVLGGVDLFAVANCPQAWFSNEEVRDLARKKIYDRGWLDQMNRFRKADELLTVSNGRVEGPFFNTGEVNAWLKTVTSTTSREDVSSIAARRDWQTRRQTKAVSSHSESRRQHLLRARCALDMTLLFECVIELKVLHGDRGRQAEIEHYIRRPLKPEYVWDHFWFEPYMYRLREPLPSRIEERIRTQAALKTKFVAESNGQSIGVLSSVAAQVVSKYRTVKALCDCVDYPPDIVTFTPQARATNPPAHEASYDGQKRALNNGRGGPYARFKQFEDIREWGPVSLA